MSRRTSWIACAALALSLAACRGGQKAAEPTEPGANADTSKTGHDVTGGGMLPGQLATVSGQVRSLRGDELTLKKDQGGEITLTLSELEAKKSGEHFTRDDLKEGTEVRASYSTQGSDHMVDSLEIVHPAPGAEPRGNQ